MDRIDLTRFEKIKKEWDFPNLWEVTPKQQKDMEYLFETIDSLTAENEKLRGLVKACERLNDAIWAIGLQDGTATSDEANITFAKLREKYGFANAGVFLMESIANIPAALSKYQAVKDNDLNAAIKEGGE